jgi:hypothetical protein
MTGGIDPPAVAYTYAPGRGGEHAAKLLDGFNGILQSLSPRRRGSTAMPPTRSWPRRHGPAVQ